MSLGEANSLPLATYAGLFAEFNYRYDPDRDKNGAEPPPETFVLEQMRLLRTQGVTVN